MAKHSATCEIAGASVFSRVEKTLHIFEFKCYIELRNFVVNNNVCRLFVLYEDKLYTREVQVYDNDAKQVRSRPI